MAKLYPPYLEGTIPAFYGGSITVPFSMNRAVGKNEVKGFSLIIKTIQTSQQIGAEYSAFKYDLDKGTATFNLSSSHEGQLDSSKFAVGQSYKVQLAFKDNEGTIGYYSTVAIVKYTTEPEIKIKDLDKYMLNSHLYNYLGEYTTKDITEKMYSCQFKVYDQNKKVIADTGEIIHNSLNDEPPIKNNNSALMYQASEKYDLIQELDAGKNYYIQFLVKTTGLMELDTGLYQIVQKEPIPFAPEKTVVVNTTLNFDNGYISISMKHYNGTPMTGKYVLSRANSKDNFKSWNEIMRFTLDYEIEKEIWKDFTIEQGIEYKYAIFMIDKDNNYSTKVISDIITADFEDMFLFDGDRQLKIRFDPSVSSFKNTILESKSDTIGGKYPYFFRNGHINYKDFGISGLLSHLTDEDGFFEVSIAQKKFNDNSLSYGKGRYGTQLNSENFTMEREFKLEVLNWLTNGEPKLFRSPSEGNYIIKLMNVSLSPVEGLGRMLHSFSGQAYEMKEYTHKNLVDLGIIKDNLLIGVNKIITPWSGTEELKQLSLNHNYLEKLGLEKASGIMFYPVGTDPIWVKINDSNVNIQLSQNFQNVTVTSLKASEEQEALGGYEGKGSFTLYYSKETIPDINNNISQIEQIEVPLMQFCGVKDIYSDVNIPANLLNRFLSKDKEYLSQLFYIKAIRRDVIWANVTNEQNWDTLLNFVTKEPIEEEFDKLYAIYNQNNILIGYKDHGISLKLNEWSSLKGLNNSEKYLLKFTNKDGKILSKSVKSSGLNLTSEDMDFEDIVSISADIFLDVVISCRLGIKTFFDENDYEQYNQWISDFQRGVYSDQEGLEELLANIQKFFWEEGDFE